MKSLKSEHGFTLLELLASIVILVIVLTSFFSFFTQSAMFSKKNEDNLVAMNLAREVLERVKEDSSTFPHDNAFDVEKCFVSEAKNGLIPCLTYSEDLTTITGDTLPNILRVTIEIRQVEGDQLLSKTYGYVRKNP